MLRVVMCRLGLAAATAMSLAPAEAQDWVKVESAQSGFFVAMPVTPKINTVRTLKRAGGDVNVSTIGCTTSGGLYYLQIIALPAPLLKGAEDAELESEREGWGKQYNGKVIDEKRIKFESRVGREFTIRGKTDDGDSTVHVRVRQYLGEDSVLIVAVVAPPNRELPDDANRFLDSLSIKGKQSDIASTPEKTSPEKSVVGRPPVVKTRPDRIRPDPVGVELPGWGRALDPQKDCDFLAEKTRLSLTIKSSRHQQVGATMGTNTPRVVRDVEGDFVATVKVLAEYQPTGPSTNPRAIPFNGAGFILWNDDQNYIRLERAALNRNNKVSTYMNFEYFRTGERALNSNDSMAPGDCWIRMERQGGRILGSCSTDGLAWKEAKFFEVAWPEKLKLGLQATTSASNLPWPVTFEEFELKSKGK
jgi:regulation of enolase protein 1 (concanavalin A-like superfamily)